MNFSCGLRGPRVWRASALFVSATAVLAGEPAPSPPSTAGAAGLEASPSRPSAPWPTRRCSARSQAMSQADRLGFLRHQGETGESAVILSLLSREEARLARPGAGWRRPRRAWPGSWAMPPARLGCVCARCARLRRFGSDPTSRGRVAARAGAAARAPCCSGSAAGRKAGRDRSGRPLTPSKPGSTRRGRRLRSRSCSRRGQHGDRFCPRGTRPSSCAENAGGDRRILDLEHPVQRHQFRVQQAARREICPA